MEQGEGRVFKHHGSAARTAAGVKNLSIVLASSYEIALLAELVTNWIVI
jgi:hypothetical protein